MNCIVLSDYLIAEFLIYGAASARLNLGLHWRQEDRTWVAKNLVLWLSCLGTSTKLSGETLISV